jgi:hypothetical protein
MVHSRGIGLTQLVQLWVQASATGQIPMVKIGVSTFETYLWVYDKVGYCRADHGPFSALHFSSFFTIRQHGP